MCTLSFADGSHSSFHSYTKLFFLRNVLIFTKTKKINPVYVRIKIKIQILRALLSNKNEILHF